MILKIGDSVVNDTQDDHEPIKDPLVGLYQLDNEEACILDRDVLMIMARMLDDIEDLDVQRKSLRNIMTLDKINKTRILSLLQTLIRGVSREKSALENNVFTR